MQDLEQRAALDAAAAERELATQGAALGGGHVTPAFNETTGETDGEAPAIVPLTEAEAELREVLRLEAIERRTALAAFRADCDHVPTPGDRRARTGSGRAHRGRAGPGRRAD